MMETSPVPEQKHGHGSTWLESELSAIRTRIQGLPDAEILKILRASPGDYREEALGFAREEAARRNLDIEAAVPDNHVEHPAEAGAESNPEQDDHEGHPGIHRGWYFLGVLVANVLIRSLLSSDSGINPTQILVALLVAFPLVIARLRNMGFSEWWSLLILVPFANVALGGWCLACPEDYRKNRTFDKIGLAILLLTAAGLFALIVVFCMGFFSIHW